MTIAESFEAQLDRIREGADPTPVDPGVERTPGQLWHGLLELEPEKRLEKLGTLLGIVGNSYDCFVQDHVGRLEMLESLLARFLTDEATKP